MFIYRCGRNRSLAGIGMGPTFRDRRTSSRRNRRARVRTPRSTADCLSYCTDFRIEPTACIHKQNSFALPTAVQLGNLFLKQNIVYVCAKSMIAQYILPLVHSRVI